MADKKIEALNKLLSQIENHIPLKDKSNNAISKSDVAWHLDHTLKVINSVVKSMHTSTPSTYKNNFNYLGRLFLGLGYFPRGKARAPKAVKPQESISKEDLENQLNSAINYVKTISSLDKNAYFKHPYFGNISKLRVVRFLNTHTNHHLKIINDILKA